MGNSARETERGRERMEAAERERGGADLLRMGNSNSASESAMRLFNGNNQYYKAHSSCVTSPSIYFSSLRRPNPEFLIHL